MKGVFEVDCVVFGVFGFPTAWSWWGLTRFFAAEGTEESEKSIISGG